MLMPPATAAASSAASPNPGNVIAPVGQVKATLASPGKYEKPSGKAKPFRSKDPTAERKAKQEADAAGPGRTASPAPAAPAPAAPGPYAAAIFNGLNNVGLSAAEQGYQPTPPDATGAIGPTRYVELVNDLVAVYDRSNLTRLSSTDLGSFSTAPSGTTPTDVQIQWDPQGNRWFTANISFNSNFTSNYVLFGWSKTADPSDLAAGWCHYRIPVGSNIPDFPKLGHDANFVMIGDNVFDGSKTSLPFVTAEIWAVSKPPASQTSCSGSVTTAHFGDATHPLLNADGTLAATMVPANTFDSSANGYIVSAHDPSTSPQTKVMVWHMTPGPKLVQNGDITVATYGVPPGVPQPGTSFLIDSLDGRFTQAVANFDPSAGAEAVWTQHTVAGSGRSVVRWYEFLPGSLTIRQHGQLASATDYYWNAAISPSSAGNDAMIEYNRGSSSLLSLIGAQTRTKSTALGQMDPGEVVLGSSSAADQETLFQGNCSPNPCRWGDYSGATPDPLNPGVVWGSNQIDGPAVFGLGQWSTQNFAITTNGTPPTAPAPPTGLSANAVSSSQISLTWNPSTGAASYKIQRSPDGSTGWAQIGTSTSTSFADSGLIASTTYFYRVVASNSVGDSAPSAVASATTGTVVPYSQSPQGSWLGSYGADGYALLNWNSGSDLVSLAQSNLVIDQGSRYFWASGSTAVQALQSPDGTTRQAATIFDNSQVRMHLSFTTAYSGIIHIYAVDWDVLGRREIITVSDGSAPKSANITTDFSLGAWVNVPISVGANGTVTITVTQTAGMNAVVSGIFLGGAPPAPSPPTGVTANGISATQISLGWTASSGATSYKVQRSPDGSTGWTQVGTSNTTSFSDSGLIPSTTYFYRVLASNGPGLSAPSSVISATTQAGLPYSQSPQGSWVGNYGNNGYALLNWNGGSDLVSLPQSSLVVDQGSRYFWASGSTAVQALQSPDASTRQAATLFDANQVSLHLTFSAAYNGSIHVYAVDWDALNRRELITVNDGSGPQTSNITTDFSQGAWVNVPINVAAGGTVSIVVARTAGLNAVVSGIFLGASPPSAPPTGLVATAVSTSQVNLTWNASSGVSSYKIQRSPDGSAGWAQVGTSTTTTFSDSGLNPATAYFYRVLAAGASDSAPSNVASATTLSGLGYSQAPQGTWVGAFGADGYALLGWGNANLVSLQQSSLVIDQGALYEWNGGTTAVQALQSPDASTRHAATVYDGSQVRLHLTFSTAYSGTLHLYAVDWDARGRLENITVDDGSGPRTATIATDFSQGVWINAPINVGAGGTVTITVTQTAGLNAVLSGLFLGGAPLAPPPPTGLSANAVSSSQIGLSWAASSGATSYKIQRSADGSTGWTQVGTSTATTFTDSGLVPSTAYFYRALASNGPGLSGPSNVASATTSAGLPYTQAPQGTWVGTYGAGGYALLGWNNSDLISLSQCTLALDQGAHFEWTGSTTAVQALQSPDATTRHAATDYDANQVRLHLTFSSAFGGNLHLYVLDWDAKGRREIITVNDGSGPQTANINTDVSLGAWVSVPINVAAGGTVTITVTLTAGPNAVLSGIFLG
ncbi:MAG TPA: fibronectin type III domain-containing protein [Candidatus Limnocylindrales bacterium]|nr:fibronectin type III domain-containing protein [Candidatus Limnocylindrales bacterium]